MTRSNKRLADSVNEEAVAYVQKRLKERSEFKKNQMYDAADEIRDELRSKYGVAIDDRTREWSVEVDQFTVVDSNSRSLRDGASQRPSYTVDDEEGNDAGDDDVFEEEESNDDQAKSSLEDLTVPQLKEKLKAAGLPVSGRKAELIERLTAASSSD